MKTLRLLTLLALAQIMFIAPAAAQEIVVDRMSASEEASNAVQYPYLNHKIRFSVDIGFALRVAKMADGIPSDLAGKMRTGIAFGSDLLYFPDQAWGLGATFSGRYFNAKTSYISTNANMYYFAAMGAWRAFDRYNKNAWILTYSLGYLSFKDVWTANYESLTISKGGVGTAVEIGYDIRTGKKSFIGFKLSLMGGNIKLGDIDGEAYGEDTTSLNFTAGLRF